MNLMSDTIKIKLVKSPIGRNPAIVRTVKALGFKRLHQVLEKKKIPSMMGMIGKVRFMLEILP